MYDFLKYYEKAGGIKLIKQYLKSGVLFYALLQFLITGCSKTGLEILRLSVNLKIKKKLFRKFRYVIKQFDKEYIMLPQIENKTVWVLWWQGFETAPDVVKFCYDSLRKQLVDWNIVPLTKRNYSNYITIPQYVVEKHNCGKISFAHFADIIRLELLINHGGLWIDSTVLCTSNKIPFSILNSNLFVFQNQKPGADGKATIMSNWLIYAKSNNKILMLTLKLIYEYWKKYDYIIDYFFFHHFFTIACEHFPVEAKKIPPFCNSIPHILLLHLFDPYDEQYWNDLKQMTCFHKLSYKFDKEKVTKEGTYFKEIVLNKIEL